MSICDVCPLIKNDGSPECPIGLHPVNESCVYVSAIDWHPDSCANKAPVIEFKNCDMVTISTEELAALKHKASVLRKKARSAFQKGREKEARHKASLENRELFCDCDTGLKALYQMCKVRCGGYSEFCDQDVPGCNARTLIIIFNKWKSRST